MYPPSINDEISLPCGLTLPNRLVKAATTEGLADENNWATRQHETLYQLWATDHNAGGTLITGNIQVDRRYLERPGNVAIDGSQSEEQMGRLRAYATAGRASGTRLIAQLGHPGRQCNALVNTRPLAPSAVRLRAIGIKSGEPRAMTREEIEDVVRRFARAAKVCEEVGFDGVQIHAAHGYLLSSFLNPHANVREDEYGGSLENRSRIIHDVLGAVRAAVKRKDFCVGIKLNSADFSKNGFTFDECVEVASSLDDKVDFLEVSGGNYESPSMMLGPSGFQDMTSLSALGTSTQIREAYFLEFSRQIKKCMKRAAVMVTGGMRTRITMDAALEKGDADLIGVCRPVCGDPRCVGQLLRGKTDVLPSWENTLKLPTWARWTTKIVIGNLLTVGAGMLWFYDSIIRMSERKDPDVRPNLFSVMRRVEDYDKTKAKALKITGIQGLVTNNTSGGRHSQVATAGAAIAAALLAHYLLTARGGQA